MKPDSEILEEFEKQKRDVVLLHHHVLVLPVEWVRDYLLSVRHSDRESLWEMCVIEQKGRFGTTHYITLDKPKGDYQKTGMLGKFVFDSTEDALSALAALQKKV